VRRSTRSIDEWYKPGGSLSPEKLADDVITMALNGLHVTR
jgi:Tetracyclin repressor-like, C-terminal domain